MLRDIDADFLHRLDRARIEPDWMRARAVHLETVACQLTKQTFRYLAASRIAYAKKQHALFHEQQVVAQQAAGCAAGFIARTKPLMNFPSTSGAIVSTSRPVPSNRSRASAVV